MKKLFIFFSIFWLTACENNSLSIVVKEYDVGKLNIKFSENKAYNIGANYKGMPVFKDTKKALKQAKLDYKEAFKAIALEYKLKPISHHNYKEYEVYSWQTTVMNERIQKQCVDISKFLDIYENSFP
ncbi:MULTISPECIES: hypothetical protein [Bacillaceae]|uniref:Lipoprotein n=1 Tax=Gottfriedia luciferensis TaxID=178774 RepID=A0ABX2ZS41_9BACI|nr:MULTISPECIES: hypothetical protein [Bacillaceae]ODG92581.1 hypothetical protein BED47_19260 [Gottfriedia luciferensis]PGZ93074.1 hypothetical protein COE53_08140 [Bacillus sp. AFS029533]SFD37300.1 hypothetical protein SAMN02799633_03614 [Bacillus sp. UNCCL81]